LDGEYRLLWLARALRTLPEDRPELESYIRRTLAIQGQMAVLENFEEPPVLPLAKVHAVSPDGRQVLASRVGDGAVGLWTVKGGEFRPLELPATGSKDRFRMPAFSPDSRLVVSDLRGESGNAWYLWEAPSGRLVGKLPFQSPDAHQADFSSDGALLALVRTDSIERRESQKIEIFETATRKRLNGIPSVNPFRAIRFHPDGRSLWTIGSDCTVQRWGGADGKPIGGAWIFPGPARAAFSRDGRVLVVATADRVVQAYEPETRRPIGPPLKRRYEEVDWFAASPGGEKALVMSKADTPQGILEVFEFTSGRVNTIPISLTIRGLPFDEAEFSPDGRFVTCRNVLAGPLSDGILDCATGRWLVAPGESSLRLAGSPTLWSSDGKSFWIEGETFSVSPLPGDASAAQLWAEVIGFHELAADGTPHPIEFAPWDERRLALHEMLRTQDVSPLIVSACNESRRWPWWRIEMEKRSGRYTDGPDQSTDLIGVYDLLRKLDPTPKVRLNRAEALLKVGAYLKAIEEFDALIAKGSLPDRPELYQFRGRALAELGRWAEAIRDLSEFRKRRFGERVATDKDSSELSLTLGDLALLQVAVGDTAAAIQTCNEALALLKGRKTEDHGSEDVVLMVYALAANTPARLESLRPWIEQRRSINVQFSAPCVALYLYRTGQFPEAVEHLATHRMATLNGPICAAAVRTMAAAKLGRQDELKASLDQFLSIKERYRSIAWDWKAKLDLRLLETELDALLAKPR
jgi:tetratricopeptide (TPR) repeat protein